ncbi:MAG: SLBB domain-containing protein [Cyanobacteria bacterium SZAS-4]|nr:SLBB domain-containing protein [Cyanobacteria bacterium SZAS-4]
MFGLVKKVAVTTLAFTVATLNCLGPSCLASTGAPALKELSPVADTQPVKTAAAAPIASPQFQGGTPKTFKLNAGITQEYVLGPGDVMSVTDLSSEDDKPASTALAPVLPDGTAVINYCGVIEAAGLSLRQINELVNEKAKKWYVRPEIIINLAKQRATQVYLLGELQHPGLYSPDSGGGKGGTDATGDMGGGESGGKGGGSGAGGAASSIFTVSSALEMAGGLKDTADIRHIHVTRLHPKQVLDVDLWKLMLDGDVSEDLVLQPGDVVYVPKGGADFNSADFGKVVSNSNKVRVMGAFKSPGLISMSGDDDILSVIARAGGLADYAKTGWVYLARTSRDGSIKTEKVPIGQKAINNPESRARVKVRPGDVLVAKTSYTKKAVVGTGRLVPSMMMQVAMMLMLRQINNTSTSTR